MDTRSVSIRPKAAVVALAMALGIGGLGLAAAEHAFSNNPPASLKLADPNEGPSRTGFAPIVKRVLPTVVNISSTKVVKTSNDFQGQSPDDDFFRQFFGGSLRSMPQMPSQQRERGLGSGVIVSPEGYILTNNHVVDGATDVKVTLSDKRDYEARVVGTDPKVDIAVLKIDASEPACHRDRRFFENSDWRLRARSRQPLWRRQDRDHGNRQRHRPFQPGHRSL